MYANKGYVPVGTNPADVPDFPTSTVTTTLTGPPLANATTRLPVPNVRGVSSTQALNTLTNAGLYGAWTIPFGLGEIPASWVVTAQQPAPGTVFPYRSPVGLTFGAPR